MAVILSPGDHWPGRLRSDTLVHNTPLLSGFKKTKLKHGAVCLTSLVFRHLRFGQSPGVAPQCPHPSPELSVSMSYSLWSGTWVWWRYACRGSLPRSLLGKIEFNGRMPLSTRINQMSSSKLWPSIGIVQELEPMIIQQNHFPKLEIPILGPPGMAGARAGCPVSVFFLKPILGAAYKRDLKSAIYDAFCLPSYLSCNEGWLKGFTNKFYNSQLV